MNHHYDINHDPAVQPPRLELGYDERPSWRTTGTGRKVIRLERMRDGSIELKTMEFCHTTNRARETFTSIPADLVPMVLEFIQPQNQKETPV